MGLQKKNQASRPLHGIAHEATDGLEHTKKGLILRPEVAARVRERLVLNLGSPDLQWAVRSLLILAARVARHDGTKAANSLVEIACVATQAMGQLASESKARRLKKVAERNSAFLGIAPVKHQLPGNGKANRVVANALNKMPRRA